MQFKAEGAIHDVATEPGQLHYLVSRCIFFKGAVFKVVSKSRLIQGIIDNQSCWHLRCCPAP